MSILLSKIFELQHKKTAEIISAV